MATDPASPGAHRLLCGRLAGLLFVLGSGAGLVVNLLVDPPVDERVALTSVVGLLSGAACFAVRWDRLDARWLHVLPVLAVAEVVGLMWAVDEDAHVALWFLVLVVVFAGYAFERRRDAVLHLALVVGASAYPSLAAPAAERAGVLSETALAVSMLVVAGGIVVLLRERLAAANAALATQALMDPLTGVGNRRLLDTRLGYELDRHDRSERPFSVLMLDLDGFKAVNDELGHPAGDLVLREVADALWATVRRQDTLTRPGGDEFCVLAPETDAEEAEALADRIRFALGELRASGRAMSAGVGVATFPDDGTSAAALLAVADEALRGDKPAARGAVRTPVR